MSGANLKMANETRAAIKRYNDWEKAGRPPVKVSQKKEIVKISPDEKIVPLYNYLKQKIDRRYYLTDKGTALSFEKGNEKVLRGTLDKDGYVKINISGKILSLHRAVWFSFAYADKGLSDLKDTNLVYWKTVNTNIAKIAKNEKAEIHHIDKDRQNNALSNLNIIPNQGMHNRLKGIHNFNDFMKEMLNFESSKPVTILIDGKEKGKVLGGANNIPGLTDAIQDLLEHGELHVYTKQEPGETSN